jgi:hypothetical protein
MRMTIEQCLEPATRVNTQRSYASALRHFEVEWGGHLPAAPDSVLPSASFRFHLAVSTLAVQLTLPLAG